jgi:hypothetical protein
VEILERRELLTTQAIPAPGITDMAVLAALHGPHEGPTYLYLNFDGSSEHGVSSFTGTTSDMHEILFRTAQMFAPFNVQVQRIALNGSYPTEGGHTTVFIGDKVSNSTVYEGDSGTTVVNTAYAYAPGLDYPNPSNYLHVPNSDPYNLAFVDPYSWIEGSAVGGVQNYVMWTNDSIARTVAHEAGHSFGLAHVLSGGVGEVMSYDAGATDFSNVSYPVTILNNNGVTVAPNPSFQPMWAFEIEGANQYVPYPIQTQNSFAYLNAALGPRNLDGDYANLADKDLASPFYVDGDSPAIGLNMSHVAGIGSTGDYDVFQMAIGASDFVQISVNPTPGSVLDPIVMIFDASGQALLAYNDDGGVGNASQLVFLARGGQTYQIVVGGYMNNDTGAYLLEVSPAFFELNPYVLDFDLAPNPKTTIVPLTGSTWLLRDDGQSTRTDAATELLLYTMLLDEGDDESLRDASTDEAIEGLYAEPDAESPSQRSLRPLR